MKVLFVSAAHTPDMSAGFLWDGLQSALGSENVVDALEGTRLQNADRLLAHDRAIEPQGQHRVPNGDEDDFDMIVATSTFLRDRSWSWLANEVARRLKKDGKVVWFETLDDALDIIAPQIPMDAVFKREIDPGVPYPYGHKPLSLLCGIPERWFSHPEFGWTEDKPYDIFHVSNAVCTGYPIRWSSLSPTFCTSRRTKSLVGDATLQPNTLYLQIASKFKLVICTPGGGCSSDSTRCWETIAMGGIPFFLGQPSRPRWPWFTEEHIFWCDRLEDYPGALERALDSDLHGMRLRLKEHALKWHTTEQRARQFLRMVAEDAFHGAPGPWRW